MPRRLLEQAKQWAKPRTDVVGLAVVGSHATKTAHADSDVDLVVVVESVAPYKSDDSWLSDFGTVERVTDEDYGLVQSRRCHYAKGPEIEWVLADRRWLRVPPDPKTARVVKGGIIVLYDPEGRVEQLRIAAASCT
jgi:predicted nucleotidyltransferase